MAFDNRKGRGTRYDGKHQAERKRRLQYVKPTDPCGYCGKPLGPDTSRWHLPHNTTGTGYLPGFWHRRCNEREAAIRGARKVNARRKITGISTLRW